MKSTGNLPGLQHLALAALAIAGVLTMARVSVAFADDPLGSQLARMRDATASFHQVTVAQAAGYDFPVPGCFELPGTGGMGYHYLNFSGVDLTIDVLHPEAMVYAPGPNGQLQLGAIEYLVPAALWDTGHSEPPQLFGHPFLFDGDFGTYELHAWIWKNNPSGMFEPWNPTAACPN